jgi:hypothetical protein
MRTNPKRLLRVNVMNAKVLKSLTLTIGLILALFGLTVSIYGFGIAYNISWGMSDAIRGIAELLFGIVLLLLGNALITIGSALKPD